MPDWKDQDQILVTAWRQLGGVKKLDNLWPASEVASSSLPCTRAEGKEQISVPGLFSVSAALCFMISGSSKLTLVAFVSKGKPEERCWNFIDMVGGRGFSPGKKRGAQITAKKGDT